MWDEASSRQLLPMGCLPHQAGSCGKGLLAKRARRRCALEEAQSGCWDVCKCTRLHLTAGNISGKRGHIIEAILPDTSAPHLDQLPAARSSHQHSSAVAKSLGMQPLELRFLQAGQPAGDGTSRTVRSACQVTNGQVSLDIMQPLRPLLPQRAQQASAPQGAGLTAMSASSSSRVSLLTLDIVSK